jgi:hypothetical protein
MNSISESYEKLNKKGYKTPEQEASLDSLYKQMQEDKWKYRENEKMEAEREAAGNPLNFELNYKARKEKERKMNLPDKFKNTNLYGGTMTYGDMLSATSRHAPQVYDYRT